MANEQQDAYMDQTNIFLTDVNVKLRDIEEKQNLIRDRILLIGENLVAEKEETEKELSFLKNEVKSVAEETRKIKLAIQRIIESQDNFARKSELELLERQAKMFQPLELARISDVEEIVRKMLEKQRQ